jgi:Ca2+-binding RTX toxin-like protein
MPHRASFLLVTWVYSSTSHLKEHLMIESLEQRNLMAIVTGQTSTKLVDMQLSNGTLTITGSSRGDSIYIRPSGSNLLVTAYNAVMTWGPASSSPIYTSYTKTYVSADVEKLVANLKGGNDLLHQELGPADATVYSGEGNDKIRGRFGSFEHFGHVFGEGGNDILEVSGQFCNADGGAGADTFRSYSSGDFGPMVDYSTRTAKINADMNSVGGDGETGENDDIEKSCFGIIGGSGNDYLAGSFTVAGTFTSGEGRFYGNDGNDTIFGGVGYDAVFGGAGDDKLHSGPVGDGPDIGGLVDGGADNDEIWGTGSAFDMLIGGGGTNVIHANE